MWTREDRRQRAQDIAYYCQMSKRELMARMTFYTVNDDGNYLGVLLRPGSKILAVAHIDFHCSGNVHKANAKQVVSSALDDRLGVYLALDLLPKMGVPCDVLLCDDEEMCNSTMRNLGVQFLGKYNWIIELDYPGIGATTYDYRSTREAVADIYGNVARGSFSDISLMSGYSPVGAFNAGVGYRSQHTERCVIELDNLEKCVSLIQAFYAKYGNTRFVENDDIIPMEFMHDTPPAPPNNVVQYRGRPRDYVPMYDDRHGEPADYVDDGYDDSGLTYAYDNIDDYEMCSLCNLWLEADRLTDFEGYFVCAKCAEVLNEDSVPAPAPKNHRRTHKCLTKGATRGKGK